MSTDLIGRAALLRPGTIVALRFPLGEGEGRAKARPCLVIATTTGADGAPRITIAYGTSSRTQSNRGLDLALSDPDHCQAAGLRRPTRFVLARRITVSPSDPALECGRTGSPVIGALPPSATIQLRGLVRSLGATVAQDRRRGSPGRRSESHRHGGAHQQPRSRREPVIVRVARKRYTRPVEQRNAPQGRPASGRPPTRTQLRLAASRG